MINKLILKEGFKPVLYALILTIISALFICSFLTTLLAIVTIVLVYIFRNSSKRLAQVNGVLSPTDGTVTAIDKINNKDVIYIKLGLLDSHILRAPISSTFKITKNRNGVNLNADSFKAKKLNQKINIKFNKIKISLLADQCNLLLKVDEEKEVSQTNRFAVMISGEIKITLEKNMDSKVKIGQKVYAGKTTLA